MIRTLALIFIGIFFSNCTPDNSRNIHTFTVISKKLISINNLQHLEVFKLHAAMTAEIKKIRNEQNSQHLDSIKINIDSLAGLMEVTLRNIDTVSHFTSLSKVSDQWTEQYNELKINKIKLDSSFSAYPLNVAKQFLTYDVMYCTSQNLYKYAIKIE